MYVPKDGRRADIAHIRYLVLGEYQHSSFKNNGPSGSPKRQNFHFLLNGWND
jgi:hypothetical protein